jgi:hypothetical protein
MRTAELIKLLIEELDKHSDKQIKISLLTGEGSIELDITGVTFYEMGTDIECEPSNEEIDTIYELKEIELVEK